MMYVGAANADASPEQRERLWGEMLPILGDRLNPPNEAMAAAVRTTKSIMGPGWKLEGEWDDFIQSLLKE